PVVRAAPAPGLTVGGPGLGARLTRLGHGVGSPQVLAGLQVPAVDVATHAELAAGASGDERVLDHQGSDCGALTRTHVTNGLLPDFGAICGVQREQVGVRRYEVDLAVGHRAAAVDVPTAERDIEGRRVLVAPELLARLRVESPEPAVPAGDVHDAVHDKWARLERIGRSTRHLTGGAGLEHPDRADALDVVGVDLVQQAVPLAIIGAVVGEPVM